MPPTPASRLSARASLSDTVVDPTPTTADVAGAATDSADSADSADTHAPDDEEEESYPTVDEVFPLTPITTRETSATSATPEGVYGHSPNGTLIGGAAEIAQSLADASMPGSFKSLALHLLVAIYAHQPKRWPPEPLAGTYHVHVRQMARDLDDSPGNVSTRLKQLIDWHLLGRGEGRFINVVWFRPVGEWDETLFDRAAARARHRRIGAGAPARARPPASGVPVTARSDGDVYRRPFTPRELIVEALGVDRLTRVDDVWPVVEHFQRTFDEAFRVQWLATLLALLDAGHTPALIIATASEIKHAALAKGKPGPYRPWGYLRSCLANAPTVDVAPTTPTASLTSSTEKGTSSYAYPTSHTTVHPTNAFDTRAANAPTVYRPDPASAVDSAPTATPLARAQARSRARYARHATSDNANDRADQTDD